MSKQQLIRNCCKLLARDIKPGNTDPSDKIDDSFMARSGHESNEVSHVYCKKKDLDLCKPYVIKDCKDCCSRSLSHQLTFTGCVLQKKIEKIQKLLEEPSCASSIVITPEEIKRGYVIRKPGKYCVEKNTIVSPPVPSDPTTIFVAITINASNVVLDLNNTTLSESNDVLAVGVLINSQSNIVIKNGTIRYFELNGIRINSGSDLIIIKNVKLYNNGCPSVNPTVNPNVGLPGGLTMSADTNILIKDSEFNENIGVGCAAGGVNNVIITRSEFNSNQPTTAIGFFTGVVYGLGILVESGIPMYENGSLNISITNSTYNNNIGSGSAFGLAVLGTLQELPTVPGLPAIDFVHVDHCDALGTMTAGATSGLVTEGITLLAQNAVIKNSNSLGTLSSNPINNHLVGLETSGSNIVVENCVVQDVVGVSERMAGFDVESLGSNVYYRNCQALTVTNNNTQVGSFAYGFGGIIPIYFQSLPITGILPGENVLEFSGTNIIFENCLASGVSVAQVITPPTSSNMIPVPSLSAGFLLNSARKCNITNCVSSNNQIGILIYDYISPGIDGFGGPTVDSIIKSNQVFNNSVAGIVDANTLAGYDAFIDNYARANNGASYVGPPPGTPIVTWTIGTPPPPTDKLSNLNILP